MARMRTPEAPPSNSLVASAARMSTGNAFKNFSRIARSSAWQTEAWAMYHSIGEFRYACDLQGSLISRAVLFAAQEIDGKPVPVQEGTPADLVNGFFTDADARAEFLRLSGIHLAVAGEYFILGYEDPETNEDDWSVVASTALKRRGDDGPWIINNIELDIDPDQVTVTRVWRPDPENSLLAMSPTRAVLTILAEIQRLTEHVAAQVDSRLAGAGLLLMPSEMTFPTPPAPEGSTVRSANTAEDLMAILTEAMATSIQNRADASALVPIVITAPEAAIAAVKHLTFWTELDAHAIQLRTEAIRRLALGMDMPPEMLLGMGTGNHWAAWQADESAIKAHAEPLLKIITAAVSSGILRPVLKDDADFADTATLYSVQADTSEMRLRPNRSKEALELYDRGALNAAALRRETGFDPADEMKGDELAQFFLRKVAGGSTTPELVEAALRALNVPLGPVADDTPAAGDSGTTEARPTPSLKDHPVQDIPDQAKSERRAISRAEGNVPSADVARKAALMAASEQIAIRALERAGNRLKNKMQVKTACAASDIHTFVAVEDPTFLLEDAWGPVAAVAERHGFSAATLEKGLDGYCRSLLLTRTAHDYNYFTSYMDAALSVIPLPARKAIA